MNELKRLRLFVAVAEELHFGRAALRLGMAQPPLSRQVAQLEKELGVLLFDRGRNQIQLTQAGSAMLARARDILQRAESAYREVRLIGQGGAGRLSISFVGSATLGPLPNLIKSYRSHYPKVELALATMNNAELERALIQREIDIAVARPGLEDPSLRHKVLLREPLVLAMPDNAEHNAENSVALDCLRDQTLILYPRRPRPSFADHVLGILEGEGIAPAEQVYAQDYQTAISLVAVGVGYCMVPESVSAIRRAGVMYKRYRGANPGTGLSVNARIDNRSPHVMHFFQLVESFTHRAAV
ncbi:LysR family transcriptional regulator [Algiphilus sp.]|uniref:LysR family transcriptional regulator n=1 Tax=Algiphilus sp. TaxID=1872431 RepID=UPI003BA94427